MLHPMRDVIQTQRTETHTTTRIKPSEPSQRALNTHPKPANRHSPLARKRANHLNKLTLSPATAENVVRLAVMHGSSSLPVKGR
jgi:aspartate carbamoyltransferase catalytic subunit